MHVISITMYHKIAIIHARAVSNHWMCRISPKWQIVYVMVGDQCPNTQRQSLQRVDSLILILANNCEVCIVIWYNVIKTHITAKVSYVLEINNILMGCVACPSYDGGGWLWLLAISALHLLFLQLLLLLRCHWTHLWVNDRIRCFCWFLFHLLICSKGLSGEVQVCIDNTLGAGPGETGSTQDSNEGCTLAHILHISVYCWSSLHWATWGWVVPTCFAHQYTHARCYLTPPWATEHEVRITLPYKACSIYSTAHGSHMLTH